MTIQRSFATALAALAAITATGADAAQRHFVASTGIDSNPCSITAPCRSFAAAALVVDPNGEIIVQDTAGYGFVNVTKSLSILSPYGVYAGISVFGGQNGVTINVPGGNVRLTGLYINGQGGTTGILVQDANRVTVEGSSVTNMLADGFTSTSATARIVIRNSVFRDNGGAGVSVTDALETTIDAAHAGRNAGAGFSLASTRGTLSGSVSNDNGSHGVSLSATVGVQSTIAISDHKSANNTGSGIDGSQTGSGAVFASVSRSALSGNTQHGAHAIGGGQGTVRLVIADSQITANGQSGVTAENPTGVAIVHGNAITQHGVGVQGLASGLVRSAGNNSITDNTVNTGAGYATYTTN